MALVLRRKFLEIPLITGILTFCMTSLVAMGWALDIPTLKHGIDGFVSMKFNTALGLAGLALTQICLSRATHLWGRAIAGIFCVLSMSIALLTLMEYSLGLNFGIDEFFFADTGVNIYPGRMAPVTAVNLLLVGTGVFITSIMRRPYFKTGQTLFLVTYMISIHALMEYLLLLEETFGSGPHTRIALHTAISFVLLSVGFLFLSPFKGYMRIVLMRSAAGSLARTLVVALIFAPPLIKYAVEMGANFGIIDKDSSALARSVVTLSFFIVLALRNLQALTVNERRKHRSDRLYLIQEKQKDRLVANHKLAEAALMSETRMRAIFDLGYEAIVGFREDGCITDWNLQAEKIFGWKQSEVVGLNFFSTLFSHDMQDIMRRRFSLIANVSSAGESQKITEVHMQRKNNSRFPAQINVSPIYLNGDLLLMTSIEDISERKNTEKELIRTRQEALVASRAKSEFLANMSHEIRTPMNGIIGMATMLADENLTGSQLGQVEIIKKSAESLVSLINGILDHSRIESGQLTLEMRDFDLQALIEDTVAMFRFLAMEKQIELKLDLNLHGRRYIHADSDRIRQILVNLIGNAIKFTEKGTVSVHAWVAEEQNPNVRLRFEVKDSGPGMSQPDTLKLFQANSQTLEGRKKGGAGLGLYISRRLVEVMGGKISVQSVLKEGTTFAFDVSAQLGLVPKTEQGLTIERANFSGLRVLVVEDQFINQQVAIGYLNKLGIEALTASNGQEALQLFEKEQYDLILMDCRMPVMNGDEATQKIRTWEKVKRKTPTPIVGLSAEVSTKDRDLCLSIGMNDFLSKPLDFDKLVLTLKKHLSGKLSLRMVDRTSIDKLVRYASNGQYLLRSLVDDFERVSAQSIEDLTAATQERSMKKLSDVAHSLKSACATLGAHSASNICADLEKLQAIPDDMEKRIFHLNNQLQTVKKELHEYISSRVS